MQRITSRAQFQAVLAGKTLARTSHFSLHSLELRVLDTPAPQGALVSALFALHEQWLGAMIPKRWARRAVTRNAIRRQVYSLARAAATNLPRGAYVVRLRSAFDRQQFVSASSEALKTAVRGELVLLFERAGAAAAVVPQAGGG